jgi:hypothetical protein
MKPSPESHFNTNIQGSQGLPRPAGGQRIELWIAPMGSLPTWRYGLLTFVAVALVALERYPASFTSALASGLSSGVAPAPLPLLPSPSTSASFHRRRRPFRSASQRPPLQWTALRVTASTCGHQPSMRVP